MFHVNGVFGYAKEALLQGKADRAFGLLIGFVMII